MTLAGAIFRIVLLAFIAAPALAEACPVCFSGTDDYRMAFLTTAIGLTFLPLGMIGGLVAWFVLRVRRQRRAGLAPTLPEGVVAGPRRDAGAPGPLQA